MAISKPWDGICLAYNLAGLPGLSNETLAFMLHDGWH